MRMTLFRSYPASVRIEYPELEGLMRVLDARMEEAGTDADAACYKGAHIALSILRHFDRAEYPVDFMALFDRYMKGGDA